MTAARELIYKEKVAVLFGGLDTPVSMAIVPLVNQEKVPFMGPWAAGTGITKNGANPNYAFRVSAMDEIVDQAMLQYAQKTFKAAKPALMLGSAGTFSGAPADPSAMARPMTPAAVIEVVGELTLDLPMWQAW